MIKKYKIIKYKIPVLWINKPKLNCKKFTKYVNVFFQNVSSPIQPPIQSDPEG